jgi:hypothetical protein
LSDNQGEKEKRGEEREREKAAPSSFSFSGRRRRAQSRGVRFQLFRERAVEEAARLGQGLLESSSGRPCFLPFFF